MTVSLLGVLLAAAALYFGALLPFFKAQSFINAERRMASVRTVEDFENNFNMSFDLYSPVGTEEITKFLGNDVLNILNQGQAEDVSRQLVTYIEGHLFKDEVRHLLLAGQLYQTLWKNYGHEEDYQKAVSYFEKAHEIGPNLPPPLYTLLNLYGTYGDKENFERIGRLILANWPQDQQTKGLLEKGMSSSNG